MPGCPTTWLVDPPRSHLLSSTGKKDRDPKDSLRLGIRLVSILVTFSLMLTGRTQSMMDRRTIENPCESRSRYPC